MPSAAWSLQKAVFAALAADAPLIALIGDARIYDDVPQSSDFPYLTFGQSTARDWSTATDDGSEHTITLNVWSQAKGRNEVHEIMAAARAALQGQPLTLDAIASSTCATSPPKPAAPPTATRITASPASAPSRSRHEHLPLAVVAYRRHHHPRVCCQGGKHTIGEPRHMQETTPSTAGWLEHLIGRMVVVQRREIPQLLASFALFFCVLAAYYVIRPVREEMGVRVGREWLQTLFVIVFFVMLAAVPLFGWVASSFAKRRIVPVIYGFFILNLVGFWVLFGTGAVSVAAAGTFFVWVSVFNLFAVSLFWSTMADTYSSDDAKRLYGLIAAGGSIGAISGPLITQSLVHVVGTANLLLVSAGLLCGALAAAHALRNAMGTATAQDERLAKGGLLAGAVHVWRSPYLFRIALWVLLANLIGTFFYFEQARIIGETYSVAADRVQLFARMDLVVNVLTILGQLFVAGWLLQRVGIGVAAAALPVSGLLCLMALAIAPVAAVIVGVMIVERAVTFAIANPALRVLFTVVPAEDKYKAQNFIDTVVFRGGDAASGWLFGSLAKSLGVGMSTVALLTVPLAAVWAGLSLTLGHRQAELADKDPSSRPSA